MCNDKIKSMRNIMEEGEVAGNDVKLIVFNLTVKRKRYLIIMV